MAIDLTLKSVQLTNRDATPNVKNNVGLGMAGSEKVVVGHIASVTASLSITSIIRLVEIPSNAIVTGLDVASAAQTAGKFDIGIARTTQDGGAIVDQDFFVSALDAASAVAIANIVNESTTYTIAKQSQRIWEAVGMTSDPKSNLDVIAVVVTTDVTTGAAAFGIKVRYVDNG